MQATAFGDLPEVPLLQQIQGAAEPGAIEGGHLAAAVEWMRAREVDYRIPVAGGRPGAEAAEAWLGDRGYEQRRGLGETRPRRLAAGLLRRSRHRRLPPGRRRSRRRRAEHDRRRSAGDSAGRGDAVLLAAAAGRVALLHRRPRPRRGAGGDRIDADRRRRRPARRRHHPGAARGRGCNAALLHRRLLDAARAGCHTVFVEVGECDLASWSSVCRNLRRAGFEEAYEGRNWQRPALHPAKVPGRFSG